MNSTDNKNNQFINDILFAKDTIKSLEDKIFSYYPKIGYDILPWLHKAYDNLTFVLYRLNKSD